MARLNDELEAERRESEMALRELEDADDDEVSGVIAEAAAEAASRTAARITMPDSDSDAPPLRKKPSGAAVIAALVTLATAAAGVVQALRAGK